MYFQNLFSMASPVYAAVGISLVVVTITYLLRPLVLHYAWVYKVMRLPTLSKRALPLLGHLYLLPKEIGKVYFKWMMIMLDSARETGKKFIVFWLSSVPVCFIVHPDAAETLLKSNTLINKPKTYEAVSWLGDGLVLSKGSKWFHRRRLITPSFHFKILDDFLHVMNEQADIFVSNLTKLKDYSNVDLVHLLTVCTLDIICETAMGIQIKAQENTDHHYVRTLERVAEINTEKFKNPLYNINAIFRRTKLGREMEQRSTDLQSFTKDIIKHRLKENEKKCAVKGKRQAFLDMLMNATDENGNRLTIDDLQEEVDTFMFAGHDTNATAMIWTLYLLGQHPEVQKKLQQEVDEVFADEESIKVTSGHLGKLKYMEMVIKESLRLFPPVSMIGRCIHEDAVIDGHKIPANTIVYVMIYVMHRNPDIWKCPNDFNPERFSKENSVGRHPFAFVPFSAGPRNCIGQRFAMYEQKVILTKFLKYFNVFTKVKQEDLEISIGLVTRPIDLFYVISKR